MSARSVFFTITFALLFMVRPVFAEVKVFEIELDEIVSNDQSREQVEAFTLQKARRLVLEEAAAFIQALAVVQNYQLNKEEVSALSSGVAQAKITGMPEVQFVQGVIHVKVKARIQVETGMLDTRIAGIMKEKGALVNLVEAQAALLKLEGKLSTLKSAELTLLEELNARAAALEREQERQRLFRVERELKSQAELNKTRTVRLQKERELQERMAALEITQEKQRKQEADALENEQDRFRHARLENEHRWAGLARKTLLTQQAWHVLDESLSLDQAREDVRLIKEEFASLKKRMEYQFEENVQTLNTAYAIQSELTKLILPLPLTEKDAFESTEEYAKRRTAYESAVKTVETANAVAREMLIYEENLMVAQEKVEFIEQRVKLSTPFIERLKLLQVREFLLPDEQTAIELGAPSADRSCFPVTITYKEKTWSLDWKYSDRNKARDLYSTRTNLQAEALARLDDTATEGYLMTAARITHSGTGEQWTLAVAESRTFAEVKGFNENNIKDLEEARKKLIAAKSIADRRQRYLPSTTGLEFSRDGATVYDIKSGLIWAQNANITGRKMTWYEAMWWFDGKTIGGLKDWRLPTRMELKTMTQVEGGRPAEWLRSRGFSNAQTSYYWSSTSHTSNADYAWYIDLYEGIEYFGDKARAYYVWPVRSGQ